MAKDPAFLFYSQDFLVGTMAMPFEERGKYITLLCYMHQNGHISEETIRLLVGSLSVMLRLKFLQDSNGFFYNERLENEVEKRVKFVESRQLNGLKGGRPSNNQKVISKNLRKTDRLSVGKPTHNLIEDENVIVSIIDYLNNKVSSNFKSSSKANQKLIQARLKEGYSIDDFKKVIDIKTEKWLTDTSMCQYLRPETLFGNKFEGYLNEKHITSHHEPTGELKLTH